MEINFTKIFEEKFKTKTKKRNMFLLFWNVFGEFKIL